MSVSFPDRVIAELRSLLGAANVLTEMEDRLAYSIDGTMVDRLPQVIVLPETPLQVSLIVQIARREHLPITPRGSSSGLSGGSLPSSGGIAMAMTRMNRIIEISVEDQVAVVQPGVITGQLQTAVEKLNLFYPPDPSSLTVSAIGGNIAENAGGARCLKYGVTGDYVMGLQVVLASGDIIRPGGRMIKNVTGYDLRSLFTGSEGTLGIITEATLRLLPKPRHTLTLAAYFSDISLAAQTVTNILAQGILPTSIEIMDQTTLQCVEEMLHIGLPVDMDAMLLISVDGNHIDSVKQDLAEVERVCRATDGTTVQVAQDDKEAAQLWQARRSVAPALARRMPNKLGEDIAVPRSKIPEMVKAVRQIASKYQLMIPIYGHAGDGNLHPNILCNKRNADEMQRVRLAAAEIFEVAIALGGTLSGEHGIGLLKKEFMVMDLGEAQVNAMKALKQALDPEGLLNPGKIFPTGQSDW